MDTSLWELGILRKYQHCVRNSPTPFALELLPPSPIEICRETTPCSTFGQHSSAPNHWHVEWYQGPKSWSRLTKLGRSAYKLTSPPMFHHALCYSMCTLCEGWRNQRRISHMQYVGFDHQRWRCYGETVHIFGGRKTELGSSLRRLHRLQNSDARLTVRFFRYCHHESPAWAFWTLYNISTSFGGETLDGPLLETMKTSVQTGELCENTPPPLPGVSNYIEVVVHPSLS